MVPDSIANYCRNIYESVSTIAAGMWITFKTAFFERKVTLQYPSYDVFTGQPKDAAFSGGGPGHQPFELFLGAAQSYRGPLNTRVADRFRGLLGYDEPKCIACLLCMQVCPIDVIAVKGVRIEGRKGKAPLTYTVDYAKCMFCGLCVEICPTDAVFFTRQFEAATFDFGTLVREFIPAGERRERQRLAAEASSKPAKERKEKKEDENPHL
jgi:NADH-quinone oxidoreductase subunit I